MLRAQGDANKLGRGDGTRQPEEEPGLKPAEGGTQVGGRGSPWGQAARGHPDSLCNVRGPTSSATCVASSLPSLVAATLGDRAGQDQEEEGQSRDRQKVPATACAAAAAAAVAAATSLPPSAWPPTSSPTLHGIFGSLDTGSGPGPPATPPTEQGHEKVRLGRG